MRAFTNIFRVFFREIHKIVKDKNLLLVFFLAPITYPAIYGAIYYNKMEVKVPVAVIDEDNSSLSRGLIREIGAMQQIDIAEANNSIRQTDETDLQSGIPELDDKLAKGEIQGIVIIPKDFAESLKNGKLSTVKLYFSTGRLLVLSDLGISISQAVTTYATKVTANVLAKKGVPVMENKNLAQPIKFDFQLISNPWLTYGDMILPALISIIFIQLMLVCIAGATAKEWSLDKWSNQFTLTRNPISIIYGKIMAYLTIFITFGVLIRLILIPFFDVYLTGKTLDLFIILCLAIFAVSSFGLFLGSFFRHRITVFATIGFTSYPFFMSSGFAWPTLQMPEIVQKIAYFLPSTPFLQCIQLETQLGTPLEMLRPQIVNFIVIAVFYQVLFCIRLYFLQKKSDDNISNNPITIPLERAIATEKNT